MQLRHVTSCLAALGLLSAPLCAQDKKDLTFDQIWKNAPSGITQPLPNISGWADDTHYIEVRNGKSYQVDVKTGAASEYSKAGISVAVQNHDIIYTAADGTTSQLTNDTLTEKNPTLSPDGKYVAFTRHNDLYSVEIATKKETRYTSDASEVVYNGYASWVYYEEILGRPTRYRAFWWSPDSRYLAYMRFDDSQVPVFPIYSEKGQHGYTENTRYPKAGDKNPEVKVGVVPVSGGTTTWAAFDEKADQYFGTPFWTSDNHLWLQWMNRGQDNLKLYDINLSTGAKKEVYDEKQATWIDWKDGMTILDKGRGFIIESDKTGWSHLYWYNMDGSLKKQLTSGNWTVNYTVAFDAKQENIYFVARKEASTRTDLYKVNMNSGAITRLTFGDYFHATAVSPHGDYFISAYSNLATPTRIALMDNKGKVVRELGNSKGDQIASYNLALPKLMSYTTRDGLTLPMTVTMPLHMQEGKKYPVLISIYGGPNAGTVYDRWNLNLTSQWWAEKGVIQVVIDNRSSGQLGKMGMNYIHRKTGIYEIEDYMDATKWLRSLNYVDTNKVCITGGSFGGYMTCMALTYGASVFNYGMANYSVTDWQLYDSHYTERYMDSPAENPEGYRITSPMHYLDRYKGLIRITHGTMDDNVHIQNSIQLVNMLEDMNKHFEFMVYPGERHGWRTSIKNRHSDMEMYRFIYRYLLEEPFPADL
ncbi:S9 family peptidase [Chitinophaga sancti]|uniref:Dipeptidyl-peptidase-4 n=1 Tax=Chitinophaga sancti TaxID=1004 RepID=A0A1K1NWK0_9BACT|nr:S9 family peptidase [Chitinophaga sancti]WQD60241.1 S9 family peptidase [Chitinophaga sancti]WQG87631.1 S9 family peptidase [Chitinophaga sancti]SFW39597.1 dipeptidyl-peptidase-4 [Chitinophaga sancti]